MLMIMSLDNYKKVKKSRLDKRALTIFYTTKEGISNIIGLTHK
jgi:hypothetical protein